MHETQNHNLHKICIMPVSYKCSELYTQISRNDKIQNYTYINT